MPENVSLFRVVLFCALVGFGVFCFSYTVLVWRRRNSLPEEVRSPFRGWFRVGIVLGLGLIGLSILERETQRHEGVLVGERLFTVRAKDDCEVISMTPLDEVRPGDVLVKFRSRSLSSELEELRVKAERLKVELEALPYQPTAMAPDLVVELQRQAMQAGQTQAILSQLLPAQNQGVRDIQHDLLLKKEDLTRLDGQIQVNSKEIDQVLAKRQLAQVQARREEGLLNRHATTVQEVEIRRVEVQTLDAELQKLRSKETSLKVEREQVRLSMESLEQLNRRESQSLDAEFKRANTEKDRLSRDSESLDEIRRKDQERSRLQRSAEAKRLALQVKETEVRIAAIEGQLTVTATSEGRIVYRSPFSSSPRERSPVLVVSQPGGFRFRARMPSDEVPYLKSRGEVAIDLASDSPLTPETRFVARYRSDGEMDGAPGSSLVELDCVPPGELARAVAEGETPRGKLTWRAPPWTRGSFRLGVVLILLGGFGMAVGSNSIPALRGVDVSKVLTAPSSDSDSPRLKLIGPRSEELPEDESALEVEIFDLGTALRRSLFRQEIEWETIAGIEGFLFRHPTPTFKWLRDIFDDSGEELRPHLMHCYQALMSTDGKPPFEATRDREMCYRLLSIMQVVCPEMISLQASAA